MFAVTACNQACVLHSHLISTKTCNNSLEDIIYACVIEVSVVSPGRAGFVIDAVIIDQKKKEIIEGSASPLGQFINTAKYLRLIECIYVLTEHKCIVRYYVSEPSSSS